jgi:3-hydroxybutyryl-CoA dehydrogenase
MIGMHFMNPVPVKKFVEMIRAEHTSEETIESATALVKRLGKQHVLVNDFPGFVSNRVMMLAVNECAFVVQDDVADPATVDKVFRLAFGHSMGPLATADLIGLDTVLNSIKVLFEEYKDSKYRPCPLLQRMVDAGYLGRKSGKGFFTYTR